MSFQDEMKQMFLQVAAGKVEPQEWKKWWDSNKEKLEKNLTRGDRMRIMPTQWHADYSWMTKTQSGVAYYLHAQGRPVKTSPSYEEKARHEEVRRIQRAMEQYHMDTASARRKWEEYLAKRPADPSLLPWKNFHWKSLLGTPPGQEPAKAFGYQKARTTEQWKACKEELKFRLKENLQAKIAPAAKAYGMKKAGSQTFVRERPGIPHPVHGLLPGRRIRSHNLLPLPHIRLRVRLPGSARPRLPGGELSEDAGRLGRNRICRGSGGRCQSGAHQQEIR